MAAGSPKHPRDRFYNDPKVRSVIAQVTLSAAVVVFTWLLVRTTTENLARAGIASGFGFWNVTAGFDISQTLIEYSSSVSTFGRAFWVGLVNTLVVAGIGIVGATVLGFLIGIARLSSNWLVARLAGAYVELVRNVPLLLQLLFWYNAVLKALPDIRDSVRLPFGGLLNNRGLFLPTPLGDGVAVIGWAALAGVAAALAILAFGRHKPRTRRSSGLAVAALVLPPLVAIAVFGGTITADYPQMGRFNIRGGSELLPEFVALTVGLVVYTASFIAEVVRAGLMAVPRGQVEAAASLGLRRGAALRLIIVPQAMRVIIPPLTNQYLNLTKNSSLAVAIGYPDLVQVFAGTVLNITGQAVEIVVITMAVYLVISLVTSSAMNLYDARLAFSERR
jgi:general L-amino acid transport system permease protein